MQMITGLRGENESRVSDSCIAPAAASGESTQFAVNYAVVYKLTSMVLYCINRQRLPGF